MAVVYNISGPAPGFLDSTLSWAVESWILMFMRSSGGGDLSILTNARSNPAQNLVWNICEMVRAQRKPLPLYASPVRVLPPAWRAKGHEARSRRDAHEPRHSAD